MDYKDYFLGKTKEFIEKIKRENPNSKIVQITSEEELRKILPDLPPKSVIIFHETASKRALHKEEISHLLDFCRHREIELKIISPEMNKIPKQLIIKGKVIDTYPEYEINSIIIKTENGEFTLPQIFHQFNGKKVRITIEPMK